MSVLGHETGATIPVETDDWLSECREPSAGEFPVLQRRAVGQEDREIMEALGLTFPALRSRLRRFSDRTGLGHLRLVAWCQRHSVCCLEMAA